jgi:YidC/Oxa1 family membrane protein insertase
VKSFDFFSLDYIYYPVSGIMWVWHKVFGSFLGANNAWAWVLSVVFLVFTLRSLLFKPFMGQMNSQMKMQAVAPELKKLREKYKDDRTRLAEEMQKFNKEAGVNPLGGCLPALIQAPVFIGLFHVLKMFRPGQGENYFFGASDVSSFVDAKLFGGAPLSSFMTQPWLSTAKQIGLQELGGTRSIVIAVGIPLTILAGIATFLTSRRSVARQQQMQNGQDAMPQAALMNKLMKYVFPLFVVVGGPFFPLAILFYWLSNNTWTFGQLYVAHRIQDKKLAEQSMVVEAARQEAKFTKPAPGARPTTKPSPGAKPVRPTPTGQRATATRTPGGRPTTAGQRPVVQPTPKSPGGKSPVAGTATNGSASNGGTSNGGASNGAATNGHASGADTTVTGAARPSLSKPSGSTRVTPVADAGTDLPAGTLADASKPKPAIRKKKPGRR